MGYYIAIGGVPAARCKGRSRYSPLEKCPLLSREDDVAHLAAQVGGCMVMMMKVSTNHVAIREQSCAAHHCPRTSFASRSHGDRPTPLLAALRLAALRLSAPLDMLLGARWKSSSCCSLNASCPHADGLLVKLEKHARWMW
ncbi:hypothetical protein Dimus_020437, partial [Dionaea muscipula]